MKKEYEKLAAKNYLLAKSDDDDFDEVFDEDDEEEESENIFGTLFEDVEKAMQGISISVHHAKKGKKTDTPMLDKYGVDAGASRTDKIDPVIGREREIERIAQILSRRKKNNPILLGEPGVGKTAIVEGLALRIKQGRVPRVLLNKRIIMLNMNSMVAGTCYRGDFEKRMEKMLGELKANPNIILFIDELHTIVGAGSASGTLDAANILKPALARGDIQCIGSTTPDEYRNSIEKDGALERRFQKVVVEPSTPEETLTILRNVKEYYEQHHNVFYTDDALKACVELSGRYINDRYFPDKAFDVLDEAGSRGNMQQINTPAVICKMEREVAELAQERDRAAESNQFEQAAKYRDKYNIISEKLAAAKEAWQSTLKTTPALVDVDVVESAVANICSVPVERLSTSEEERLLNLEMQLGSKVLAQGEAIAALTRAIKRNRMGLKDPRKPIGSFLFLGQTGVGKTYLAKQLALALFGSEDALIRIDMSEYMEKHTASRLVGAPPGYVGYDEGGQLTERVRRKPYSIVLLDEIEKAHGDIFNMLLQVMDDGRLTDSNGRTVDFKNTVIIMTSNIGSRQVSEFGSGIGFMETADISSRSRSIIEKALKKQFAPEFLNRIDEIITFAPLRRADIEQIIDVELLPLSKRVEALGYAMQVSEQAKKVICDKGYDERYGARPLKRVIQNHIEDKLAELMLNVHPEAGATFLIDRAVDTEDITISLQKKKKKTTNKRTSLNTKTNGRQSTKHSSART